MKKDERKEKQSILYDMKEKFQQMEERFQIYLERFPIEEEFKSYFIEEFKRYFQWRFKKGSAYFFLYPLFFQEYIYALSHDHNDRDFTGYGVRNLENDDTKSNDNKSSLVSVKRVIFRMCQDDCRPDEFHFDTYWNWNLPPIFWRGFLENGVQKREQGVPHWFYMLSRTLVFLLEIPYFLPSFFSSFFQFQFQLKQNKEIPQYHKWKSSHSLFPFFEDKIPHLDYVLNMEMPDSINIEVLIQILQCQITDAPSLHLLRFFLYEHFVFSLFTKEYPSWRLFHEFGYKRDDRKSFFVKQYDILFFVVSKSVKLFYFLYNSYVYEWEFVFWFLRRHSSHLLSTSSGDFLEQTNFYGKIEHLVVVCRNDFQKSLRLFKDPCIHYVRYLNHFILASKGPTYLLIKKWKCYFFLFWQCHFYIWSELDWETRISKFSNPRYSLEFGGFHSSVLINALKVRSQMLEDSFRTDTVIKEFDAKVPIFCIIPFVSYENFTNFDGGPVSKVICTDLSDSEILFRFANTWRLLFDYYSGSSEKKSLYQLRHAFQLSCARTLAHKYKTTVRTLLQKRLGSGFLEHFLTEDEKEILTEEEKKKTLSFLFPEFSETHLPLPNSYLRDLDNGERIWYFHIHVLYNWELMVELCYRDRAFHS